jgi:multidrug efflux pump subunit AcrA (membrane-fusion protein)
MRRSRRLLVVLLAIAAGAAAIAQVPLRAASATKDAAVPVRVAVAMPAARAGEIRVTGTLHFKREISLAFKVQGYMAAFEVESGDTVKKGQILARIDSTEVRSRGSDAQAQLDNATAEFKRTQELFEQGFASQARVDAAKDLVLLDGKLVSVNSERKYFLLYKPPGVVTTRRVEKY